MSFESDLINDMTKQMVKQIDQDIMNSLMNGNGNMKNVAFVENIPDVDFTYDDVVDKFVYSFMDNDNFTKEEKNIFYDFGQIFTKSLNVHRLCTFLPLHDEAKIPMVAEMRNLTPQSQQNWYRNYASQNMWQLGVDCNFDTLFGANVLKFDYLEAIVESTVHELHFNFVEYLKREIPTFEREIIIDPADRLNPSYNSVTFGHSVSISNFHKNVYKIMGTRLNSWILGSKLNFSLLKDHFGDEFTISGWRDITERTGICVEGIFSGNSKHETFRSNPFSYITHPGGIQDSKEELIVGNWDSMNNESLSVGIQMTPYKCNFSTLGVKITLILLKNPIFSNNYKKLVVNYKNM
jgi:hypothetical protein